MPRFPLRALAAATILLAGPARPEAHASPTPSPAAVQLDGPGRTFTYSTRATFSSPGGDPSSLVGLAFQGVTDGTARAVGAFQAGVYPASLFDGAAADLPLGRLIASGGSPGEAQLDLHLIITAVDGVSLDTPQEVDMTGTFRRALQADGSTSLQGGLASWTTGTSFSPPLPTAAGFTRDGVAYTILDPGSLNGGASSSTGFDVPLDAQLMAMAVNAPEPAAWAAFALAGLGIWAKRRSRA